MYKWTVNWKMIPEEMFLDSRFAAGLLATHLILLGLFAQFRWMRSHGGTLHVVRTFWRSNPTVLQCPHEILFAVFTSNLIGIIAARSLHFQFYSWYYQSLPFLLWQTSAAVPLKLLWLVAIEACWNVFPSTALSSTVLMTFHISLLVLLWFRPSHKFKRAD
jgi:alpha-1,3-mannosyltransferase